VLLITNTTLAGDKTVTPAAAMDKAMGRQGELVPLNGQHQPTIPATPDAPQRWRLINACVAAYCRCGCRGAASGCRRAAASWRRSARCWW